MNYLGSKVRLLPKIKQFLKHHSVPELGLALDAFAGTGVVSELFQNMGYLTYTNDWQYFAFCGFVRDKPPPQFLTLSQMLGCKSEGGAVLNFLEKTECKKGLFYEHYCEGGAAGRLYFSEKNGQKIQGIRDEIDLWKKKGIIDDQEFCWLIGVLISAADKVSNTASVYGAYLKSLKTTATRPLSLGEIWENNIKKIPIIGHNQQLFCQDVERLFTDLAQTRFTLTYLDPPYNQRQYCWNYHLLETIARWDMEKIMPRGKTGQRPKYELSSAFSKKRKVEAAFIRIFELVNTDYLLLSYNNEGLLSMAQITALFKTRFAKLAIEKIKYKRFVADDRRYLAKKTEEWLFLGYN